MRFFFLSLALIVGVVSIGRGQSKLADSLKNRIKEHLNPDSLQVDLLLQLANEEMYNKPADAGQYAFEARVISEKIHYPLGLAQAYRLLGNSFWAQANQTAALENFLHGLQIADSIRSPQVQADLLGNLGMVYNEISDYQTALRYYKASLVKQVELKNKLREAIMRLNVGNGFYRLKQYDSSLFYYRQSSALLQQQKNVRTIVDLLTIGIGEVYAGMGQYTTALDYFSKAKKSCDTTRHHRGMVHVRMAIAKVMIDQKQFARAERELLECLSLAQEVNMKAYVRDSYELLSKVAEAQGDLPKYIDFFKRFIASKDSIQNTAQTSKITSLQLDYEMKTKQLEVDALRKNDQLKQEEIVLKNWLLISAIGCIFLGGLIFINVSRHHRHQKKLNIELAARNEKINRQRMEIMKQRDEVLALNEEIRAQQDEVVMQRDELEVKNKNIEELHKKLMEVNQGLEKMVEDRTAALTEQNKRLEEYAFINAHKLRSPVANVLGLINLLESSKSQEERTQIQAHLQKSAAELDEVIRSISSKIQEGINIYQDPKGKRV